MRKPRPGWFTVLQSYFREIFIESASSAYSGKLEVTFYAGRYMLNTRDATYSFEDKYSSFAKALDAISDSIPSSKRVLVLGLGLGSVPWMLQKKYRCPGQITCVDIDPLIVQLAEDYYPDAALFRKLEVIVGDAAQWIGSIDQTFDLIAVDLFIDRNVPVPLHGMEFLSTLRSRLAPHGTLLFSRLKEEKADENTLWENLAKVFPGSREIDTGGNVILCYRKDG